MTITTSPDITNLAVSVKFDISGTLPVINLSNLSTGSGLANMLWAFVASSPSGTLIHAGSIDSPDITGSWNSYTLSDAWPKPFNSIEWSGAPYSLYVIAKDSNGNIFTTQPTTQTAYICRPAGNTQVSKNNFGIAQSNVSVRCQEARVFFEDTTYHSYKGSDGTRIASILRVIYPIDETGNIPAAFQIADYSTALVPISYSSNNYQFMQTVIYDYDLGNDTTVRIKYQTIQTFSVWCNVDLEPLVCEFNKLIDSINNGSCNDVSDANRKLSLISPKMMLVFMGIMQPLTGIDVPSLIDDIKEIGGFDCNCCEAATGIIPTTSSVIDGYNFIINPVCGDINGTVTLSGTNITFNLQDKSYIITVANESPSETTAFTFEPSLTGCQKTYALKIDGNQLAYDILNIIKNNSALTNLLNSITGASGSQNLVVDGKCIFNTANCNYIFTLPNIPTTNPNFALLTSIGVNGISHIVNFAFNTLNISSLQAYLNTLGYGTFAVTSPTSGTVVITSNGNTNDLTSITYSAASVNYIATLNRVCTSYAPITSSQAVQNVINFLCGITDSQIQTSQDYIICYVDPVLKTKQTVTISGGAAVTDFIIELLARGCDTINYVMGLSALTCENLQAMFPLSPLVLQNTDYFLGSKNGNCARIFPTELGTSILQLGMYDSTFMTALCAAVELCGAGKICDPFTYFYLTVPYSSPSDDTMNIVVNFAHPEAVKYTIRYARIDNTNTPSYITIPNVLSSPYVITGLPDGQYFVGITPIYADGRTCSEVTQTTPMCAGINSFSVVPTGSPSDAFLVSYNANSSIPKVRVNISYPNGGSSNAIYTNDGMDITIPYPTAVFGAFSITMQPVCNSDTGYFGANTAPVIINVPDSSPPINYTLSGSFNFSIDSVSGAGIPTLPPTGTTGSQSGHHSVMSGSYSVTVSGSVVTTTKIDVYVNGINVTCAAVTSSGTYVVGITAASTDTVLIAIDSGGCS